MKFIHYIIPIILFSSINVLPQWEIISPQPFVDKVFVKEADSAKIVVFTEKGNIAASTDTGKTWSYNYLNGTLIFENVYFFSDDNIWGTYAESSYKSTDGGLSWEFKGEEELFSRWTIYFDNPLLGWKVYARYVKSTTDGGNTWLADTLTNGVALQFITAYNDSIMFTGGRGLFRSTDKGRNWKQVLDTLEIPLDSKLIVGKYDSLNFGILHLSSNKFYITTDGGESWLPFLQENTNLIKKMGFADNLLIAVSRDKVLRSSDLGKTWDSTEAKFGGIYDFNLTVGKDNIVCIRDHENNFFISGNAGESFNKITRRKFPSITEVSMLDSLYGFIHNGYNIYKTTDGGKNFSDVTPPDVSSISRIFTITKNLAAFTHNVSIYITKDGGLNWKVDSFGSDNNHVPLCLTFKDSLNGFMGCSENMMRITTDGGETWSNKFFGDTAQIHISSISFPNENVGFFAAGEKLYKSIDGGQNWFIYKNNFTYFRVDFIDSLNGVAGTQNVPKIYTTDGGKTWNDCTETDYILSYDIIKNGESSVLVTSSENAMYTSFDLGRTWEKENIIYATFRVAELSDPANIWFTGFYGGLAKFHNPSVVVADIKEDGNDIISDFRMLQNYPNPFNPSTNITYQISTREKVALKIYNIIGQEIVTLLENEQEPGLHSINWNGENNFGNQVPSGVYLCRITSGLKSQSIKMLLIR